MWTFAGNIVYAASQWGMLTVLAKLGSPATVGQFALGLAVTAPVFMFTNLQLRGVQATDARRAYAFGDYLGLRLVATVLALFVIVGLVIASDYRLETVFVIVTLGLAKAVESISDVFYGLWQQHEQMQPIAMSMMFKGPLSLVLLGSGVYATGSVLWGTVALALSWVLILLVYDIPYSASIPNVSFRPHWNIRTLVRLSSLALPLGAVMMLISLNTSIPRYVIEQHRGERELGIFAALAYLLVAGNTVIAALGQSASPRLSQLYASGDAQAFRTLLLKLVGIGVCLGSAGVVATLVLGRQILTVLYRPEYAQHTGTFLWLMIAGAIGFVASFLGYGMTAARYFRVQLPLFAAVAGVTALMSNWLIPAGGLQGAAVALVIAALVQAVGSLLVVVHALRMCETGAQA